MQSYDLADIIAKADRRTLAAVVTHLSGDPGAVPDLRDRAAIEQLANELLPAFLDGEPDAGGPLRRGAGGGDDPGRGRGRARRVRATRPGADGVRARGRHRRRCPSPRASRS